MFEHTGLHYRFFESTQSWTDALSSCVSSAPPGYIGNLASVHDATTNTFVANLTGSIGKDIRLGGFQNSSGADEPWHWSDGSVWDYENWGEGEPNNKGSGEDYLEIWGDKWNDGNIAEGGYVCQYQGKNDDIVRI